MRTIVFYVMDRACAWTGHRLLFCYNGRGRLNKLFMWANGLIWRPERGGWVDA